MSRSPTFVVPASLTDVQTGWYIRYAVPITLASSIIMLLYHKCQSGTPFRTPPNFMIREYKKLIVSVMMYYYTDGFLKLAQLLEMILVLFGAKRAMRRKIRL